MQSLNGTNGTPKSVKKNHVRNMGLPTEREFSGNGATVVVVGVTTHQGGWENQLQGEG